jgi:hypothetical protein
MAKAENNQSTSKNKTIMEPLKTYTLISDFKAPCVINTTGNNRPAQIKYKTFKKGELVNGVMQYANSRPNFILVRGSIPIEAKYLKEVVAKEIVVSSNASGPDKKNSIDNMVSDHPNPKVKYLDALLVGAVVGVLAVHFAEKKGYIEVPDKKYKLYGALGGGLLAMYIVYRVMTKPKPKPKTT